MSDMPQNENETAPDEMTENELDQVAGGACTTGQHFPPVKLAGLTSYNQTETLSSNAQQKVSDTSDGL